MKKTMIVFLVIIGLSVTHSVFAATSNFGEKALLYGKTLYGQRMGSNKTLTDGSDGTTANLFGGAANAYRVYGDLTPNAYVDRVYIRSASASGTVGLQLTFADNTTETVTLAIAAAKTDYYADVKTKSKVVKAFNLYSASGDFNISEFDLRQGEYNPSDPAAFVISSLKVTGDHKSAVLDWSEINPEYFGQYNVYMNGNLVTTITKNATHTYTVTGLNQLTQYTFAVSASDQFKKEYGKVTTIYKTAQRPPPPAPSLEAAADDKTAALKFTTDSTYIKNYVIYQDGKQIAEVQANSYTVTGLTNGQSYSFYVVAVDDQGAQSPASPTVKAMPSIRQVPQPSLSAVVGSGLVKLTIYSDSPYIKKYVIYQDGKQLAEFAGNYYTVNGLTNGKPYSFYGVAVDDRGTISPESKTVRVIPQAPTTDSGQEKTDEYLLVKWDATEGATGYIIYLNSRKIAEVSKDLREYKITTSQGYNPRLSINQSKVVAIFSDGSTSTPNPGGIGGGSGNGGGSGGGSGSGSDDGSGGFSNVRDKMPLTVVNALKAAMDFLAIYKEYFLMSAAIIFAPILTWFIYWLLEQIRKDNEQKKLRRG